MLDGKKVESRRFYGVNVPHATKEGKMVGIGRSGEDIFITRLGNEIVDDEPFWKLTMSVPTGKGERRIAHLYYKFNNREDNIAERFFPLLKLARPLWDVFFPPEEDKHVELKSITPEAASANRKEKYAHGFGIATDSEYKNRDIMKRLFYHLFAHAKGLKYDKIYVHGPNVLSEEFYDRIGFVRRDTSGGNVLGDRILWIPKDFLKKIKIKPAPERKKDESLF